MKRGKIKFYKTFKDAEEDLIKKIFDEEFIRRVALFTALQKIFRKKNEEFKRGFLFFKTLEEFFKK